MALLAHGRRGFAALLATSVLVLPFGADAAEQAGESRADMETLAAQYEALQRDRAARRNSAAGREARRESRFAYAGQDAGSARETALRVHRDFAAAPAWRPFTLPDRAHVERYIGDFAALVEYPGGQRTLVETTMPTRAEAESGELAPVDLTLADRGSFFEPRTPLAGLRLSKGAAGGAFLPDIGLGVGPPGADSPALTVADKAFHANVRTDTDYIALPVAGGVQAAWQLRSAASPERLELDFDLPPGAQLRRAVLRSEDPGADGEPEAEGGLEVVRGHERLATVSAPVAWDADDEPVPLTYQLEGDKLVVSVSHKDGDWLYPLLVDPVVLEDQRYWRTNSGIDFTGWTYTENPSSDRWKYFRGSSYLGYGQVLHTSAAYFGHLESNAMSFRAPGDSHVYAGELSYAEHVPGWQTLVSEGVWSGSGFQSGWASNQGDLNGTPNVSPTSNAGAMGYISTLHCVSGSNCDPSAGASGNQLRFTLWTNGAGNRNSFKGYFGGAAVWLNDRYAPATALLRHLGWTSVDWYDVATLNTDMFAADGGLGVKYFRFRAAGQADKNRSHNCAGHRLDRCPTGQSGGGYVYSGDARVSGDQFQFSTGPLPDGVNQVYGDAGDVVGNWKTYSLDVKVDHSAPRVTFGGSLYERAGQSVEYGVYKVRAIGTDSYSGVVRVQMLLDGVEIANATRAACDGCSLTAEASVETYGLPPGQHTVVATATDRLGHVSTPASFTFDAPEGTQCPFNPFVDHPGLPQRPLGSLSLCSDWPL